MIIFAGQNSRDTELAVILKLLYDDLVGRQA